VAGQKVAVLESGVYSMACTEMQQGKASRSSSMDIAKRIHMLVDPQCSKHTVPATSALNMSWHGCSSQVACHRCKQSAIPCGAWDVGTAMCLRCAAALCLHLWQAA
jgi:hypothetical protein